jgi:hypothetical protein
MICMPMVRSTQTVHVSWIMISTISKWTKLSLEPRHLGVTSGASKMIFTLMVHTMQTTHLSCINICTISERTKPGLEPHHQWLPSSASKTISEPMVHLAQLCTYIAPTQHYLQTERGEIPYDLCHLGVPLGASKTISEPLVRLAQTMQLSCTDTNTISKRREQRFHMIHITQDFHRVHAKWFLSLWYVRCKCTCLASRLALSTNEPSFHLSLITSEYYRVPPKQLVSQWYIWRKLYTYLAPTLTPSPNRNKRDSTWPISPRGSIGCVQNDFRDYLHWD